MTFRHPRQPNEYFNIRQASTADWLLLKIRTSSDPNRHHCSSLPVDEGIGVYVTSPYIYKYQKKYMFFGGP